MPLHPLAASPRTGRDAPADAGLCDEKTHHSPRGDCKSAGVSIQGFFWLANPQLTVSMPRASEALAGSQMHTVS